VVGTFAERYAREIYPCSSGSGILELLYVSPVSLTEIRFGIELLPEVGRPSELNDWLATR
jgi:hypothetical protein